VCSTYLGLPCHLILRNSRAAAESDPGLVGNLLVERLVGATVHQVGVVCVCGGGGGGWRGMWGVEQGEGRGSGRG